MHFAERNLRRKKVDFGLGREIRFNPSTRSCLCYHFTGNLGIIWQLRRARMTRDSRTRARHGKEPWHQTCLAE